MRRYERELSIRAFPLVYLLPNEWFLSVGQAWVPSEYVLYYSKSYIQRTSTIY